MNTTEDCPKDEPGPSAITWWRAAWIPPSFRPAAMANPAHAYKAHRHKLARRTGASKSESSMWLWISRPKHGDQGTRAKALTSFKNQPSVRNQRPVAEISRGADV